MAGQCGARRCERHLLHFRRYMEGLAERLFEVRHGFAERAVDSMVPVLVWAPDVQHKTFPSRPRIHLALAGENACVAVLEARPRSSAFRTQVVTRLPIACHHQRTRYPVQKSRPQSVPKREATLAGSLGAPAHTRHVSVTMYNQAGVD